MPIYCYKCDTCGEVFDKFFTMAHVEATQPCVECGQLSRRSYVAEKKVVRNGDYITPLHSDAFCVPGGMEAEHREMFPDIPLDDENRPVVSNAEQHDRLAAGHGCYKVPQKQRRKGVKVDV